MAHVRPFALNIWEWGTTSQSCFADREKNLSLASELL